MPEKKDTAPKYDLEETNYPHDFVIWAEMCLNGCRTGTEIIQRKTKGIPMELRSQT